ncbi:MAG: RNA polymerase sigma factor [Sedimentisphaerales bacterium]|nr:RNA polymerase sigma factor [Sedimentisphaerales bacterium]
MEETGEHIDLIKKARSGDRNSQEELADLVRERLRSFILRVTFSEQASDDIVQETLLEMFKVLGKLEKTDRFWPWLYKMARNKIRQHWRDESRHQGKGVDQGGLLDQLDGKEGTGGLARLISTELSQLVMGAMGKLKSEYREVLTLRCYEQLSYREMARVIGCSEFGVRVRFFRAKKSLEKQLSRRGLGKGSLFLALALVGKLTAPSEAAASQITIMAATTKVGLAATVVGIAGTKGAVAVLAIAAAGSAIVPLATIQNEPTARTVTNDVKVERFVLPECTEDTTVAYRERWFYYPEGAEGPVMIRHLRRNDPASQAYCRRLQNGYASYSFDNKTKTIHLNNYWYWNKDLSVLRLPTDSEEMVRFLAEVEGCPVDMELVSERDKGLLVISRREKCKPSWLSLVAFHQNLLEEEYFCHSWPTSVRTVDNRDLIHQRGWTYFRMRGQLAGDSIEGIGRMPLVYETSMKHSPWICIKVGKKLRIVDDGFRARVLGEKGQLISRCIGGEFFVGLSRPWMGLHTIDTIRRDAAAQRIIFETEYNDGQEKSKVVLKHTDNKGTVELCYIIEMARDLVDRVELSADQAGQEREGFIQFEYLAQEEALGEEFAEPAGVENYRGWTSGNRKLWLMDLARGTMDR